MSATRFRRYPDPSYEDTKGSDGQGEKILILSFHTQFNPRAGTVFTFLNKTGTFRPKLISLHSLSLHLSRTGLFCFCFVVVVVVVVGCFVVVVVVLFFVCDI